MKHQALFSSKDKSKKSKYRLLQFLFSALRVKVNRELNHLRINHRLKKIKLFCCMDSLVMRRKNGIHVMPCFPQIISEMTP